MWSKFYRYSVEDGPVDRRLAAALDESEVSTPQDLISAP